VKKYSFVQRGWHLTIVSAICLGVFLVPIFWMISTALKPLSEINAYPPKVLPEEIDWSIWSRILTDPQILRFFLNSLIVASGTTVLTLVLAVPCAYGIAHLPIVLSFTRYRRSSQKPLALTDAGSSTPSD
jgi:multiple sugar transport system permease protein